MLQKRAQGFLDCGHFVGDLNDFRSDVQSWVFANAFEAIASFVMQIILHPMLFAPLDLHQAAKAALARALQLQGLSEVG
jgi:hypothetical protein